MFRWIGMIGELYDDVLGYYIDGNDAIYSL
jgi:hypothetical protein